jgi:hypothetical protein
LIFPNVAESFAPASRNGSQTNTLPLAAHGKRTASKQLTQLALRFKTEIHSRGVATPNLISPQKLYWLEGQ